MNTAGAPDGHRVGYWVAAAALVLYAAAFVIDLARTPLFDVDEGAFAATTAEMFQRGDFVSPHLNGTPRTDKPILAYWLQAAGVRAFGLNELAVRLPSALCGLGWIALTYAFTARQFGRRAGLLAASMLGLSLGVTTMMRAATADALLNLLIAASMFAAWRCLDSRRRAWLYAAAAAAGLGFLAKGPVALAIPLATTAAFCLSRGRIREWLRMVLDPFAMVIFAAVALPWYALIVHREGWAFVTGFFGRHNLDRFAEPLQGHAGSMLYYVPFAIAATLPFTACAAPLMRRLKDVWRDDAQCFLLLWFVVVFVLFSIAATKLPHYILYGMTGVFVLMAVHAPAVRSRAALFAGPLMLLFMIAALPAMIAAATGRTADADVQDMLRGALASVPRGYTVGVAIAIGATAWLMRDARVTSSLALVIAASLLGAVLHALVAPVLAGARQTAVRDAAQFARDHSYPVVMWRLNAPSFSFYYGAPVEHRSPAPGELIVTTRIAIETAAGVQHQRVFEKHGIVLAALTR